MTGASDPPPPDVLHVDAVWKSYRRGVDAYGSLRDGMHALATRRRRRTRRVDALCDLTLRVRRGECVGVVGPNGAGKSTLLKVVARITPPDRGRISVRGRVSPLIEVGAGFHPELTGRENVLLHGSLLGLGRRALRGRMDEIEAFAGVPDAMDVPVKQFSTGMYARLGFAVAVHADPDLLLVDEVLSVGDERFRERCYDRVRDLLRGGTGILFVSHDLPVVTRLCERAIWLHEGRARMAGATGEVLDAYRGHARDRTWPA